MLQSNFHTHTYRCGHASGTDEQYIQAAIQAGITTLGFSDHAPYKDYNNPKVCMKWSDINEYISSIQKLKEKYASQIDIHIGFETEYFAELIDEKKELLDKCEYLIFGQHFRKPISIGSYFNKNTDEEILEYCDSVCKGLETGIYTYLCHPDLFLLKQTEFNEVCSQVSHKIAQKAKETDTPLEINLRGVQKGKGQYNTGKRYPYPNYDFWQIASQYDVKCVIGVDAHAPQDILECQTHYQEALKEFEDLHLNIIDIKDIIKKGK